jgi:hypothetical protein
MSAIRLGIVMNGRRTKLRGRRAALRRASGDAARFSLKANVT